MKDTRKELVRRYWSLHEKKEMTFHQVLLDMRIQKKMSLRTMASELCCSLGIVHRWLVEEGITEHKMKFL